MRLSKENIDRIAELITKRLIDGKLVRLKDQRGKLVNTIVKAITDELSKEEALEKEVSILMEKNKGVIDKDSIDYQKMFYLIKDKLAKQKGIVL